MSVEEKIQCKGDFVNIYEDITANVMPFCFSSQFLCISAAFVLFLGRCEAGHRVCLESFLLYNKTYGIHLLCIRKKNQKKKQLEK